MRVNGAEGRDDADAGQNMTVIGEIALRQSLIWGCLGLGLVCALIYAAFFCHRGPGRWKTAVKAVPLALLAILAAQPTPRHEVVPKPRHGKCVRERKGQCALLVLRPVTKRWQLWKPTRHASRNG